VVNASINQTVLNAGVELCVNLTVVNFNSTLDLPVNVTVRLVQQVNTEWIVAEADTTLETIPKWGQTDQSHQVYQNVNITIPTLEEGGVNAPIRQGAISVELIINVDGRQSDSFFLDTSMFYTNLSNVEFEGEVLSVNQHTYVLGAAFMSNIEREYLNLPGNNAYFVQVIDDYYMGQNTTVNLTVWGKGRGVITDLTTDMSLLEEQCDTCIHQPEYQEVIPSWGEVATIYGKVEWESGLAMSGATLSIEYYDGEEWQSAETVAGDATVTADDKGLFNATLRLDQVPDDESVTIRFTNAGDSNTLAFDGNISISLVQYDMSLDLKAFTTTLIIGESTIAHIIIQNTGNTTFTNVNLTWTNAELITLVRWDVQMAEYFRPGDIMLVQVRILVPTMDANLTVNYTLTATNFVTSKNVDVLTSGVYRLSHKTLGVLFMEAFGVWFGLAVVVAWAGAIAFAVNKRKAWNTALTKTTAPTPKGKRKRQTGRYVDVQQLGDAPAPEPSAKKTTSLDSLIEQYVEEDEE
jgi:hypothetical protein